MSTEDGKTGLGAIVSRIRRLFGERVSEFTREAKDQAQQKLSEIRADLDDELGGGSSDSPGANRDKPRDKHE